MDVRPTSDLSFGATISCVPTEYQDFFAPCYSGQTVVAASGNAMNVDGFPSIHAPDLTYTANVAFNPKIGENLRLFTNANIGIGNDDGSIKLTVYARNLFDNNFVSRIHTMTFAPAGSYLQYFSGDGARTIGARLDYAF